MSKSRFRDDLEHILNCQSMENGSDTPDFILSDYLLSCLENFDLAVRRREDWYGRAPKKVPAPQGYGPIGRAGPGGEPPTENPIDN